MYIRKVSQTDRDTRKQYITYRLVESIRTERGVRQRLLLNLGSQFRVPQEQWKALADRIEQLVTGQECLFPLDEALEKQARYFSKLLLKKQAEQPIAGPAPESSPDWHTVDVNSLENEDARSVGGEHVTYQMFLKLGLADKLRELGFNSRESADAAGTVVGRLLHPGSERETCRWLRENSALDELIGTDFGDLCLNRLYEISDKLLKNKKALESHLYRREAELFSLQETICLYDLTNTYFEGSGKYNDNAEFGRCKQKRNDCRLVTLALVLDGEGFPKRSEILPGNISEPKTLEAMLKKLDPETRGCKPTVVMDAGIATEDNIAWLKGEQYGYIAVSRRRNPVMPESGDTVTVKERGEDRVSVILRHNPETDERWLYCHSTRREAGEKAIKNTFEQRYEEALTALDNGLSKKGTVKNYDKVLLRLGRLKEKYKRVSGRYEVTVKKSDDSDKAINITWEKKQDTDDSQAGVYCLRTNKQFDEKKIWTTYVMLTDLESAFRCMKSELGMRPVFHQKTIRVDGHLFITVLAYHLLHTIRFQLKKQGIHLSWAALRERFAVQQRITTSLKKDDGKMIHVRKSMAPDHFQQKVCGILNIPARPGKTEKTVI